MDEGRYKHIGYISWRKKDRFGADSADHVITLFDITDGDRKMIWHGMGKQVSKDLTPEQFLQEAGLDWEVKKVKLRGESGGKPIKGCDIYALLISMLN